MVLVCLDSYETDSYKEANFRQIGYFTHTMLTILGRIALCRGGIKLLRHQIMQNRSFSEAHSCQ